MQRVRGNVVQDEDEIQEEVENDIDIDLDKIKKTFKNKIDEQRFLKNYENINRGRQHDMHKSAKERKIAVKRDKQVEFAKILFAQQIRKQPHSHLNSVLETMRHDMMEDDNNNSSTAFGSMPVETPT